MSVLSQNIINSLVSNAMLLTFGSQLQSQLQSMCMGPTKACGNGESLEHDLGRWVKDMYWKLEGLNVRSLYLVAGGEKGHSVLSLP